MLPIGENASQQLPLQVEVVQLRGTVAELRGTVAELRATVEELQRQVADLLLLNAQQKARIVELEAELAKAKKNSRNSSKPPSSDIVKPPVAKPNKDADSKSNRGGQKGHKRHERKPFSPEQIDRTIEYPLGGCPCCGGELSKREELVETIQQIELAEKPVTVTEHRRGGGWCENCQNMVKPDWPAGLVEVGLVGPRLLALIGILKGGHHMSIGSIKKFLLDCCGVHLSRGYIAKLLNKITGCLDDPYKELEAMLAGEAVVNVDETGHKDNGDRYWTWVFRAEMFTFFRVSPSRGSQVLLDVLGTEFNGLLGCDYFSAYRKYMRLNENVRLQFCLAHLIRDVKFLATHPHEANRTHGEQLLELLKKLFSTIHRRDEYPTAAGYQNALARIRNDLVCLAAMDAPATTEAQNLANRFFVDVESYFRFISDPAIGPTNNVAEQAIRFVAIQRRITQGTRGRAGQIWSERIWTVMGTCWQQGRSAYEYLTEAITAALRHQPVPPLVVWQPNSS